MKVAKNIFLVSFLMIMCVGTLCGCTNKYYNMAKDNVSEVRTLLYYYHDDNVTVKFDSGYREQDYKIDGVHTANIPFGVVTFYINDTIDDGVTPQYVLLFGTNRIDGDLVQSPFDNSYVADTQKLVSAGTKIVAKFVAGNVVYECPLQCLSDNWKIDSDKALEIATKHFSKELKSFVVNNVFCGEVYIRCVTDSDLSDEYFWYVNFVDSSKNQYTCIISNDTGKVLAESKM